MSDIRKPLHVLLTQEHCDSGIWGDTWDNAVSLAIEDAIMKLECSPVGSKRVAIRTKSMSIIGEPHYQKPDHIQKLFDRYCDGTLTPCEFDVEFKLL